MYFDIEEGIENAKKRMKYPDKIVRETKQNIERLHQHILRLEESSVDNGQIIQKIFSDFEDEIKEYIETTGTELMQLEECALGILDANPQLVDEIYEKIKSKEYKIDIEKEKYKLTMSKEKSLEYEVEVSLEEIKEGIIKPDIKEKVYEILYTKDEEKKKTFKELLREDPALKEATEYVKIFFEESEREKLEKMIIFRRKNLDKILRNSAKNSMIIAGKFLKKYDFLQEFLESQNDDYKKLGMSVMKYQLKTEDGEQDIGVENIFTEKYLDTLSLEQITVLNAFWQNRFTKAMTKIKDAIFMADTLRLWENLKEKDYKNDITEKEIIYSTLKNNVLEAICTIIRNEAKRKAKKVGGHEYVDVNLDKEVNDELKTKYQEYFDEKLPKSDNDLSHNIMCLQMIRDNISIVYETKNIMVLKLLQEIEYNSKITNWGYIYDKKLDDKNKVLIGIDYPGYSSPLKLHIVKSQLINFLKMFKDNTVIPVYEGATDMFYNGRALTAKLYMPLTEKREKEIIGKNKKLNVVDVKYNYIRHMGNLISKKNKNITKLYPHEFYDLEKGKKGVKINGQFKPYEEDKKQEERMKN